MFRGGPYGGDYKYAVDREKDHGPFPHRGPDEGYLMGARNVEPVNGGGDWICVKPEHWIFEGTGHEAGRPRSRPDRLGVPRRPAADIPGLEVVGRGHGLGGRRDARSTGRPRSIPGPKGNFVFNASTIFWCPGPQFAPRATRCRGRTGPGPTAPTSACSGSPTTCSAARSKDRGA